MVTPLDLPLTEVTVEEFHHAWTRFELVAKAKEWDKARQKLVLPTLLCGKLELILTLKLMRKPMVTWRS